MTGTVSLDWALISVSLFNTVLLLWLGLTVLLNVDRRSLGVWLMGLGLLTGAAFFISHTAILGHNALALPQSLNLWWQIGWIPVILAPLAWYILTIWFAGYWSQQGDILRKRHRAWLIQLCVLGGVIMFLILFTHTLPTFAQITVLDFSSALMFGGTPILFVLFPVFIILCMGLSLDALGHPAPSDRLMGGIARERTRPWLILTTAILLVISLMVTGFVAWVVWTARAGLTNPVPVILTQATIFFDLLVESLLAVAILSLGQGIVSYEVFTGKALPRRGFFRHWRSAVILAGGYSVLIGGSLAFRLASIYSLLLTTALMTTFYALFSWRSFVERERFMEQLRPFVSSQNIVGHLLASNSALAATTNSYTLFDALIRGVLNTSQAQLIPLGSLAQIAGAPLVIPSHQSPLSAPPNLTAEQSIVPLDDGQYVPYEWAVPLSAERGLIGVLLLGDKHGGSLYTQEEIEIARASGERIIDMLTGEELARRLMTLQRRRLAETQIMDRRTRRALHDDVLPSLHTAILRLGGTHQDAATQEAIAVLSETHHQIANLIRTPPSTVFSSSHADFFGTLRHAVHAEFQAEFGQIEWKLPDHSPPLDPLAAEVVFHAVREAVRNAAVHGQGAFRTMPLQLCVAAEINSDLVIRIRDNGVGLPPNGKEPSGLALHSTMVAILGGSLVVESPPQGGTQVVITLPISISTAA